MCSAVKDQYQQQQVCAAMYWGGNIHLGIIQHGRYTKSYISILAVSSKEIKVFTYVKKMYKLNNQMT